MPTLSAPQIASVAQREWPRRVSMFGMAIDAVTLPEAANIVRQWLTEPFEQCRYVVTPNVDHVVQFQEHEGLRAAYADASLVLADGWPVVAASRLLRRRLPARVAGSNLVPAVLQATPSSRPTSVFLLGAAPGVAERAGERIEQQWPAVQFAGCYSPPLGFESDPVELEGILQIIASAAPDLLIVGLGAPKQELWVHRYQDRIRAKVSICAGATIDFLAGEKRRAPVWMRYVGLEWFHRMISEPRRMVKRYCRDAWIFPQLVWRELRAGF